jgi:hypothetical protein
MQFHTNSSPLPPRPPQSNFSRCLSAKILPYKIKAMMRAKFAQNAQKIAHVLPLCSWAVPVFCVLCFLPRDGNCLRCSIRSGASDIIKRISRYNLAIFKWILLICKEFVLKTCAIGLLLLQKTRCRVASMRFCDFGPPKRIASVRFCDFKPRFFD